MQRLLLMMGLYPQHHHLKKKLRLPSLYQQMGIITLQPVIMLTIGGMEETLFIRPITLKKSVVVKSLMAELVGINGTIVPTLYHKHYMLEE